MMILQLRGSENLTVTETVSATLYFVYVSVHGGWTVPSRRTARCLGDWTMIALILVSALRRGNILDLKTHCHLERICSTGLTR